MQEQGEGMGYRSLEEYMQERMDFFLWLQGEETEKSGETFYEKMAEMEDRTQRTAIFLPPEYVRQCYALTDTEYWLVLYAFASELEGGLCLDYRRKYGEGMPNLQYALHLLSQFFPVEYSLIAELCTEGGKLQELLILSRGEGALLQQPFRMDSTAFFFGLTGSFPKWSWGYLWQPLPYPQAKKEEPDFLPMHEEELQRICRIMESFSCFCLQLHGRRGTGKRTLMKRVCLKQQADAVFLSVNSVLEMDKTGQREVFRNLRLLQRLINPVFLLEFREQNMLSAEEMAGFVVSFRKNCGNCRLFLLTESEIPFNQADCACDRRLELRDTLNEKEKEALWKKWIPAEERREWQWTLLGRYRRNIGEWAEKRREMLFLTGSGDKLLSDSELWEAVLQSNQRTGPFGMLVEKKWEREDLILSEECRKQLDTVLEIADGWREEHGLRILFHGSSGTGKTMTASILAKRLGLSLFKVELSRIFDKYIGETEKHVDEIFRIAQKNNFLLFFDEADALFTKRTGIRDSNDKYANVSTAYLLQRMEEYAGTMILSTNLLNHFDDAFVRRIHFMIKFAEPDEETRMKLWKKALAEGPALEEGISYRELARAAAFSPARICAAARTAQMLAGKKEAGVITKKELWEAMELEAVKDDMPLKRF